MLAGGDYLDALEICLSFFAIALVEGVYAGLGWPTLAPTQAKLHCC